MKKNINLFIALFSWIFMTAYTFVWKIAFPQPTAVPSLIPLLTTAIPTALPTPTLEPIDVPEPIICTDDDCLNACLDRLEDVLENNPFDSVENSIYEEQNTDFNPVIYKVNGDQISDPSIYVLNLKPIGSSVPAQKVKFYYEFPELVEYRRQIIEGLCS